MHLFHFNYYYTTLFLFITLNKLLRSERTVLFVSSVRLEILFLYNNNPKSWLIGKDWCWEGVGAGGEGDNRGWDGWMPSPTRWTWVWVNSGSWWWTGRPGMLRFTGSQRVGHDWATELNWMKIYQLSSDKYTQKIICGRVYILFFES